MAEIMRTSRDHRADDDWVPVTRGVHRLRQVDDPARTDLLAWQSVLPAETHFTHLTGAGIHGLWLPPLPDDLPVWVVLPYDVPRPSRRGLRVIRRVRPPAPLLIDGLRVDPASECIRVGSRDLQELDLTCLIDAALHLGLLPDDELDQILLRSFPGAPRFRRAVAWSDPGAESIWEVLLRILHKVCDVAVETQREVRSADGTFIARGDLALVWTTSLHEYDGDEHRDARRHRRDLRRERRLDSSDLVRRGYTSDDVLHRAVTILLDADRALGREHDPSRIRAWHDVLRRSLFTPEGTEILRRRIGLRPNP